MKKKLKNVVNVGWVSVKDRLPEEDSVCVVTNQDYILWKFREATYQKSSKQFIHYTAGGNDNIPLAITHWMEIKLPIRSGSIDKE